MTPTETGLYGCPSDYPADFVTIDMLDAQSHGNNVAAATKAYFEGFERSATVTAILSLAHDLDARGLVLYDEARLRDELGAAWLLVSSSPNTGS